MALTPEQTAEIDKMLSVEKQVAIATAIAKAQSEASLEADKVRNEANIEFAKEQNKLRVEADLQLAKAQSDAAKAQNDAIALENSKQRRVQLITLAHATLVENKRSLPVDQRQITSAEIIELATSLENHLNN